eukprot:Hpha_TRINITY_DN23493_c0_g1::TRINITY_DN23493_c0_g1_i1::g.113970::m.113970
MMGGWATRKHDLIKSMRTATYTCHAENEALQHMLRQQRIVLDDLQALQDKMLEVKARGGDFQEVPKEDVDSFTQKVLDIYDSSEQLSKTNQHSFNAQIKEYLKVHNDDFDSYQGTEKGKLEKENVKGEEEKQEHRVIEFEGNLQAIEDARVAMASFAEVFLQRNRVVVKNECFFLHARNNVMHTKRETEGFIEHFEKTVSGKRNCCGMS